MSDQAVLLPKWFSHGGIILAKGHLDHSYTFWTMANYTTVDCLCFFDSDVKYALLPISLMRVYKKGHWGLHVYIVGLILSPHYFNDSAINNFKWIHTTSADRDSFGVISDHLEILKS